MDKIDNKNLEAFSNRIGLMVMIEVLNYIKYLLMIPIVIFYVSIIAIIIYFILKELIRPAISTHLNILFNSENRATYLSGFNLTCSIGEVAAGLTAGALVAGFGLEFIFYFAAAAAILVPIVFLLIYSKAGSL